MTLHRGNATANLAVPLLRTKSSSAKPGCVQLPCKFAHGLGSRSEFSPGSANRPADRPARRQYRAREPCGRCS
jgi:hypothetical protein